MAVISGIVHSWAGARRKPTSAPRHCTPGIANGWRSSDKAKTNNSRRWPRMATSCDNAAAADTAEATSRLLCLEFVREHHHRQTLRASRLPLPGCGRSGLLQRALSQTCRIADLERCADLPMWAPTLRCRCCPKKRNTTLRRLSAPSTGRHRAMRGYGCSFTLGHRATR